MGHKGLKKSTSDLIRSLSITYQNKPFKKDDLPMEKRCVLGPLKIRCYVELNKTTNTYTVTDAGHRYVRIFTGDD